MAQSEIITPILTILSELLDGTAPDAGWVLNKGDGGLLRSLDRLSAEDASAIAPGGSSIAAHVDHLRYGFGLMNQWSRGDQDPFTNADYAQSWKKTHVSDEEWEVRREELRREAYFWREALQRPRDYTPFELTGVSASVVHLAYHVGTIRQMNRSLAGPSAND